MTLWLVLVLMGPALGADVTMSGSRWRAMQAPEADKPVVPGPRASQRLVTIMKADNGLALDASWTVQTDEPGWFRGVLADGNLLVERLTWNGKDVGLNEGREIVVWVDKPGVIRLIGSVKARIVEGEGPLLPLLQAARGVVTMPEGWAIAGDGLVARGNRQWWGGASDLAVVGEVQKARNKRSLIRAQVAVGVTVGDASATVQAHAVWTAAQGGMDEVAFSAPGAGPDLEVTGSSVASFERSGDRVVVRLREANMPRADLLATWSVAVPTGEAASLDAPKLLPEGTFRSSFITKIARDGDVEVIPDGGSWETRAFAELPPWSEGLLVGTPTAALASTRGDGLRLQLVRFEPVSGPATLIDVAQTSMAFSDEGRVIMRTHLQVRNDRGAFLTVTPPPGMRFLGASVAGDIAEPFQEGRSWRIAMKKSVETVDGLLSFPVRLIMVGEGEAFAKRARISMRLPTFNAEVATHRVTVNLPMGAESKLPVGEKHVVEAFSEGQGITYGFAVGDARASEADALFQSAVTAWMANDFDDAQATLSTLSQMGAASEDVSRLQGNLDLVFGNGKKSGASTSASGRRVKEQAKARSIDEEREQGRILQEALQAELAGDYARASSGYQQALSSGKKLERLDQSEEKGNAYKNAAVEEKLEELAQLQATVDQRDRRNAESDRRAEAERASSLAASEARAKANAPSYLKADSAAHAAKDKVAKRMEEVAKKEQQREIAPAVADADDFDGENYEGMVEASLMEIIEPQPEPMLLDVGDSPGSPSKASNKGKKAKPIKYRERTEIEFDGVEITGELAKPQGALLLDRKRAIMSSWASPPSPPVDLPDAPPPPPPAQVAAAPEALPPPPPPPVQATPPRPRPKPTPAPMPSPSAGPMNQPALKIVIGSSSVVVGGVEGGVVGGVLGGTAEEPMELEDEKEIVVVVASADASSSSQVLTKKFMKKVPRGRSYQSALQHEAGVPRREKGKTVKTESTTNGVVIMPTSGATESYDEADYANMSAESSRNIRVFRANGDALRDKKPKEDKPKLSREDKRKAIILEGLRDAPAPLPPADTIDIAMGDDGELPDVKATTLDIIVPALGETVRYQHLLVPAGAETTVLIETRPKRSRRKP